MKHMFAIVALGFALVVATAGAAVMYPQAAVANPDCSNC
jgi:hypothetical protein